MKNKAVVLLSGGLDSAVTLYYAVRKGYDCRCLAFDYGQRHKKEIAHARRIARKAGLKLEVVRLNLPRKGSSLVDKKTKVPVDRNIKDIGQSIPTTYVPARNTVFLSMAASFAEVVGADSIFIGAHYEDSSGYPDCRKKYLKAFQRVVDTGTKAGLEGRLRLEFPLIDKTKGQIIKLGRSLGVPLDHTRSCYKRDARPCGRCDSCILRAKGFKEVGMEDPALK